MSSSDRIPFSWRSVLCPAVWIPPLVLFILDQVSKIYIIRSIEVGGSVYVTSFFNLVHTKNRGAAFGLFHQADDWFRLIFFGLVTIVCLILIVYWLGSTPKNLKLQSWGLRFILGGALGNLFDRVVYGMVTDFLDFHYSGFHFWAFNVADSAITVGVVLMGFSILFDKPSKPITS